MLAKGEGVVDLVYPAINFALFFSFLIWKIKDPLREKFNRQADEVTYSLKKSKKKYREAANKLALYQDRLSSLGAERQRIEETLKKNTALYQERATMLGGEALQRFRLELDRRKEHFRKGLIEELTAFLIDDMIERAKGTFERDIPLKDRAVERLFSSLGGS